ncbi:hypothetical protein JCM11641_002794 [Rhodosporidiobolus odoratus]
MTASSHEAGRITDLPVATFATSSTSTQVNQPNADWHHSDLSHPFRSHSVQSASPYTGLHPTHATLHLHPDHPASSASPGLSWRWNSRAHRKGVPPRPVIPSAQDIAEKGKRGAMLEVRKEGRSPKRWTQVGKFVTETRWWGTDWGDISWWVAVIFTVGSVFWCVNGIMFFCYFSNTSTTFYDTEAALAFLGGTTFWIGAYLGWVEALNPADLGGTFGWEVREEGRLLLQPRQAHPSSPSLGMRRRHFGSLSQSSSASSSSNPSIQRKWRWFALPSLSSTTTSPSPNTDPVSWSNLGYLANTIQLFGATCFEISVICGLPGVLPASGIEGGVEQRGRVEGIWLGSYWIMQILGSPCFIIAGAIFAIEVQERWYLPKLMSLGWHIGIWNVIGGFGFLFSGIFGVWRQTSLADPGKYQYWGTAFSTFWGSWAFLIGSYLQLLETLNKWQ